MHTSSVQTVKQPFLQHMRELRQRLSWAALVFFVGGLAGYAFRSPIIGHLRQPLHESLYYTTPAGGFNFVMKVAVATGLIIAVPVLFYGIVKFTQPAFAKQITNRRVRIVTAMSLILGAAGAAFAFFVVIPMSLHFFQGFKNADVTSLISANDYLNYVITCIMSFILMFQVPLVILFIDKIKPIPPSKLIKYEKYVIIGSLILALLLPFTYDPLTQFLVAVPLVVLYNLTVVLIYFSHKSKKHNKQAYYRKSKIFVPEPILTPSAPKVIEPLKSFVAAPAPVMKNKHNQRPHYSMDVFTSKTLQKRNPSITKTRLSPVGNISGPVRTPGVI